MNIGRAFVFFLRDRTWLAKASVALALLGVPAVVLAWFGFDPVSPSAGSSDGGGLRNLLPLAILPLFSLPVSGYWMRVMRRVGARDDIPLPRWSGVNDLLVDGFLHVGVTLVWFFGLFVTIACPLLALFAGIVAASGGDVPTWTLTTGAGWSTTPLLTVVPMVFLGVIAAASLGRAAGHPSLGAGLDVGAILRRVRDHFRTYLVVSFIVTGFNLLTTLCLASPPVVGLLDGVGWRVALAIASSVVSVYAGCVTAPLYGQAYRLSEEDLRDRPLLPPPWFDRSTA